MQALPPMIMIMTSGRVQRASPPFGPATARHPAASAAAPPQHLPRVLPVQRHHLGGRLPGALRLHALHHDGQPGGLPSGGWVVAGMALHVPSRGCAGTGAELAWVERGICYRWYFHVLLLACSSGQSRRVMAPKAQGGVAVAALMLLLVVQQQLQLQRNHPVIRLGPKGACMIYEALCIPGTL